MEDDPGAAEDDERATELSSIAAIFPELIIDAADPYLAHLELTVTPAKPLRILFKHAADSTAPQLPSPPLSTEQGQEGIYVKTNTFQSTDHPDDRCLSHLPPLHLKVHLPDAYPHAQPPNVELSVDPPWLSTSKLKRYRDDCTRLWEEMGKDQVVFTFIDHLQQAAESAFGLSTDSEGHIQLSSELKLAMLDFDLRTKREQFENETFDCGICLEPKKGSSCHRMLLCSHVFCVPCLQDFYNSCITGGDVDNVKCLDPGCGKESRVANHAIRLEVPLKTRKQDRTLNPSELLQIPITQEMVQRYVRLKRKKKLEADKNTIYCPRQWCQGAAKSKKHPKPTDPLNDLGDSGDESEQEVTNVPVRKSKKQQAEDVPMSQRLAICEDCNYAFCSVCKKGWHGELSICNPRRQAELNEEEKASLQYLQMHTTACPTCSAPAQKTMGCNHMICFKCNTHFCYLCSHYLMPDNPYSHFNDFKSPCYMRLWELEAGDGADVGRDFGGGGIGAADQEPAPIDLESDSDESLEDENFEDFDGDEVLFLADDEDDSGDDEPAPDQRRPNRNMEIEIVNFAAQGGPANRRIVVQAAIPPPAPAPPVRGRGRGAMRPRAWRDPRRAVPNPFNVAAARANAPAVRQLLPAEARALGLMRFLQLAQQDLEDEWDSDELEDI